MSCLAPSEGGAASEANHYPSRVTRGLAMADTKLSPDAATAVAVTADRSGAGLTLRAMLTGALVKLRTETVARKLWIVETESIRIYEPNPRSAEDRNS